MGLTAKRVAKLLRAGKRGRHFDGHGLNLIITGKGTGNWQRRYELHGKGHWMGLGSTHARTLAEARLRNREVSQQLEDGVDPLAARSAAKAALLATAATKLTFKEAAERLVAQRDAGWSSAQHASEYIGTLRRFAFPHLGNLDVSEIGVPHVLAVLEQKVAAGKNLPGGSFWEARTVTADRVRNRIEAVLDYASARGHRPKGPNPAAWGGNLEFVLPAPSKVKRKTPHPAVPYPEIPGLMAQLRTREGVGVKALMFTVLTAVRAGEATGATWDEVNFAEKVVGNTRPPDEGAPGASCAAGTRGDRAARKPAARGRQPARVCRGASRNVDHHRHHDTHTAALRPQRDDPRSSKLVLDVGTRKHGVFKPRDRDGSGAQRRNRCRASI